MNWTIFMKFICVLKSFWNRYRRIIKTHFLNVKCCSNQEITIICRYYFSVPFFLNMKRFFREKKTKFFYLLKWYVNEEEKKCFEQIIVHYLMDASPCRWNHVMCQIRTNLTWMLCLETITTKRRKIKLVLCFSNALHVNTRVSWRQIVISAR